MGIRRSPHVTAVIVHEKQTLKGGPVSGPRRRVPSTGPIGFAWAIRSSPAGLRCRPRLTARYSRNVQEDKCVRLGVLRGPIWTNSFSPSSLVRKPEVIQTRLVYIWLVITTMYLTSHNAMTPCWESIALPASCGTAMSSLTPATRRRSTLGATPRHHAVAGCRRLCLTVRLGDLAWAFNQRMYAYVNEL